LAGLTFALGAILILGEIILAEVVLSQIGNILILVAGIGFASLLLRGRGEAPRRLAGEYSLERDLGRGGMGVVHPSVS
jgi:hypothetical protein